MHRDRLLGALVEEGLAVFSIDDARAIADREGIPSGYLPGLLMEMARRGLIARLRRGLYAVPDSVFGGAPLSQLAVAVRLVTPSAISHVSALHFHGLTEQVPRVVTAFTPKKVVTPGMRSGVNTASRRKHAWIVHGIRYEFTTVRPEHFFGIEQVWVSERARVPITDRERTVLELFVTPRTFGGIGESIGILQEHLPSLSVERLIGYALQHGTVSSAKRLGWALESSGVSQTALKTLLELPSTGYHVLDPASPPTGARERRWMVQNNLGARPAQ